MLIGGSTYATPPVQVSMLSAELFQFIVEMITLARAKHFQQELKRLGAGSAGAVGGAGVLGGSGGC